MSSCGSMLACNRRRMINRKMTTAMEARAEIMASLNMSGVRR
jgi:hypothetical protein